MHYCIYQITNLLNGKIYIGRHKTSDLDDGYMGSGTAIKRAIQKYGVSNFSKTFLHFAIDDAELDQIERTIVNEAFVKRDDTYNINIGGGSNYDCSIAPDSEIEMKRREAISATQKIKFPHGGPRTTLSSAAKIAVTQRRRIAEEGHHWSGRTHHADTKEKIGAANSVTQRGERNSQFGTCWIARQGDEPRKVPLIDLDTWTDLGWKRGRKA